MNSGQFLPPVDSRDKAMDQILQAQIEAHLSQLDRLIRRGRELRDLLATDPSDAFVVTANRVWQQDVGVTINQLSGGSKAHWLAQLFSRAFLVRAADGEAAAEATPEEIVTRLLGVLEQAVASLSRQDAAPVLSASAEPPAPRRFEFVHNAELRPVLEQAFSDSRRALEQAHFDVSLRTSCGILEAIITDALEKKGIAALITSAAPAGNISDWSFDARIAVAERAGLIRNGCARLPAVARTYRDQIAPAQPVSESDARRAAQVLNVIIRDLDPGR
jgi:hypothetical protein